MVDELPLAPHERLDPTRRSQYDALDDRKILLHDLSDLLDAEMARLTALRQQVNATISAYVQAMRTITEAAPAPTSVVEDANSGTAPSN